MGNHKSGRKPNPEMTNVRLNLKCTESDVTNFKVVQKIAGCKNITETMRYCLEVAKDHVLDPHTEK
jgi:hypothetical protein